MWTVHSADVAGTQALGRALGRAAPEEAGIVIALVGPLGAGKTAFAQGVALGLDVVGPVVSPTFVLVAEYEGRLPLLHADLYRLEARDLPGIGLEETLEGWSGLALVEWADLHPQVLPREHLLVRLQAEEAGRRIEAQAHGDRARALLAAWQHEAADAR